jgi:hypothetical protein
MTKQKCKVCLALAAIAEKEEERSKENVPAHYTMSK